MPMHKIEGIAPPLTDIGLGQSNDPRLRKTANRENVLPGLQALVKEDQLPLRVSPSRELMMFSWAAVGV